MNVVAIIMGGGAGTRLNPLTRDRSKPAVPIGGKYRLVDIPISNCINSNIRKIYLLTQFNSVSLHQHIQSTYRFDQFERSFVRLMAAQQTPGSDVWYQGTADAVRQNIRYFMDEDPDLVVILSGDQLYRMNFSEVIRQHLENNADITISTKPVAREEAGSLGIMQVDNDGRIVNFVEKPGDTEALDALRAPLYEDERYLASMGIYVFNMNVLKRLMENNFSDFGKHIIPTAISDYKVYSYIFDGYWKDIGTIGAFWEANLDLTRTDPEFTFYDVHVPIYTRMRYLPPSKINCGQISRCLVSEGCILTAKKIDHSIVGVRAQVSEGAVIEDSILMGADYYESDRPLDSDIPIGIGPNCHIRRAIIDKNARIGAGSQITPEGHDSDVVTDLYTIRDGIVVVPKNTVIPPGTIVGGKAG